jgi:hypothetical protein
VRIRAKLVHRPIPAFLAWLLGESGYPVYPMTLTLSRQLQLVRGARMDLPLVG